MLYLHAPAFLNIAVAIVTDYGRISRGMPVSSVWQSFRQKLMTFLVLSKNVSTHLRVVACDSTLQIA